MRLENQVCTLQQAKRLKELGITQYNNALFYWLDYSKNTHGAKLVNDEALLCGWNAWDITYAAFTVAELGLMLPAQFSSWKYNSSDGERWDCAAEENRYYSHLIEYCNTEAEARAAMLIYLLENDLDTTDVANNRLLKD